MPTASAHREGPLQGGDRGFQPSTHAFGRMALQVPPPVQIPRPGDKQTWMGMVAASILTPREGGKGGAAGSSPPWFRVMTPEERRVPANRQLGRRWTRSLDLEQERETLAQLNPVKEDSASWPCDRDGCVCPPS